LTFDRKRAILAPGSSVYRLESPARRIEVRVGAPAAGVLWRRKIAEMSLPQGYQGVVFYMRWRLAARPSNLPARCRRL
jgi:hypothetical protein